MKLTILGNNGPYPAPGGACSGYLLTSDSGNTRVLMDCGTGSLANLSKIMCCRDLDAVILSHLHFDHMSDMLPMQYDLQFHPRTQPLPVFAPMTPAPVRELLNVPAYALQEMQDTQIGEFIISMVPVRHPVETYGIRVECDGKVFVYTGDTNEIDILDSFAKNADLLLADAGLSAADWNPNAPHLSAKGCGELACRAGVKRLLLSHLNPKYTAKAHVTEAKTAFANAAFAQIGETYTI